MREDCFALKKKDGTCKALVVKECENGGKCVFYKTKEQHKEAVQKAKERLASLDQATQLKIAEKYYRGKIRW